MAPKKRQTNKHLPERVYMKHNAYYFVDANKKWHRLGDNFPQAMAKWAEIVDRPQRVTKMNDLFDRYMLEVAPNKPMGSYKSNLREIKPLRIAFGQIAPEDLTPTMIYQYRDARAKQNASVAANREKSLLSVIFSKAIEWGIIHHNPCKYVKRNPESPRQRTPSDDEIEAVKAISPPIIKGVVWLSRLSALRQVDLLNLKLATITDNGLEIFLSKTKVNWVMEWDDELRACVDFIKRIERPVRGLYLFCNRKGQPYTESGFQSMWQKYMRKAIEDGKIQERYQFRDIRRKAAREAEKKYGKEYARILLGHLSEKTTNIYLGKVIRVKPLR